MALDNVTVGDTGYKQLASIPVKRGGVWFTERRWRGLQSGLLTLADTLVGDISFTEEPFPWWVMTCTVPGRDVGSTPPDPDSQVITLYAIENQQETRSIWDHPSVKAELADVAVLVDRARLVADLKALASGVDFAIETDATGGQTTPQLDYTTIRTAAGVAGFSTAVFDQVLEDLSRETPDIPWDSPIITRQSVAPLASSVRASYALHNRMLTTSALLGRFADIPVVMKENIAADLAGWWRAGGLEISQIDGATARLLQRFYYYPNLPSTFRWGSILTS